jgi:hypothetical protein
MDIETIEYNKEQIPICISLVSNNVEKLFLINITHNIDNLTIQDINKSVNKL